MGSYRRYQGALLIAALLLIVGSGAEAASRQSVPINPGAAARGSGTPTSSGGTLSIPGPMQGEYIPRTGAGTKGVPIKVQPRIDFSIPRTLKHAKDGMRFGWPGMAASIGIGLALEQVDGMFTAGEGVTVPGDAVQYEYDPSSGYYWTESTGIASGQFLSPDLVCSAISLPNIVSFERVQFFSTTHATCMFLAYDNRQILTTLNYGNLTRQGSSCPSPSTYDGAFGRCVVPGDYRPASEADFDLIGDYMASQGPEFIRDLLRDVCDASPSSPDRCFQEMMDGSALSGPTTVPGGSETTTSTTTGPGGLPQTTTTTTTTEYHIKYGDTYFDYSTRRTSTVNHPDGSTTETTTEETEDVVEEDQFAGEFADSAFPEVEPFYEVKYPDGLQGVWSNATAQLNNSAFMSFLNSFVPSFSGSCPSWSMSFDIASWASYGTHNFPSLCYVFDFIKVIILVSAAFLCRAIIFGG